jgi:hypothetical protein
VPTRIRVVIAFTPWIQMATLGGQEPLTRALIKPSHTPRAALAVSRNSAKARAPHKGSDQAMPHPKGAALAVSRISVLSSAPLLAGCSTGRECIRTTVEVTIYVYHA